jgi:hypothetical protein
MKDIRAQPGHRTGWRINKVEIRGMFLSTKKQAINAPQLPRIPPQLHHQNTTPKTPILPKPPLKTPMKAHVSPTHHVIKKIPET